MTFSALAGLRRAFTVAMLLALSCAMIPNASAQKTSNRKQIRGKGVALAVAQAAAAAPQTTEWVFIRITRV